MATVTHTRSCALHTPLERRNKFEIMPHQNQNLLLPILIIFIATDDPIVYFKMAMPFLKKNY